MINPKVANKLKKMVSEIETVYYKAQIARLELEEKLADICGEFWQEKDCFCTFSQSDGLLVCIQDAGENIPNQYPINAFLEVIGVEMEKAEKANSLDFGGNES